MTAVVGIDLGATSGRVVLGHVTMTKVHIEIVSRFANRPSLTPDGMRWDILGMYSEAVAGIRTALHSHADVASIAVDGWAVDYGLLRCGCLLGNPFHYRDPRTRVAVERVHARVNHEELYSRTGIQFLPFNTVYQLEADQHSGLIDVADTLLLIPDLITYWLTGQKVAELTNASTTGLLDVYSGSWDTLLCERLGIRSSLLAPLIEPGAVVGSTLPYLADAFATRRSTRVVSVGSHDTASAVAAVPMDPSSGAYISCGTWGLVGLEIEQPILSEASRAANFTNERGVDGRIRFLHNVMGLWLLNETVRAWEQQGQPVDLTALLTAAAEISTPVPTFDANDPRFLPPGDMASRIATYCSERGLRSPDSRAEVTRCILESLAVAFAQTIDEAVVITGRTITTVHMVGGGALNPLLCQLTADRTGREVVAGPVEATALGNVLVQARAVGAIAGDVDALRQLVARSSSLVTYRPRAGVRVR